MEEKHEEIVSTVEKRLYNRMLRNAFMGFGKSALVAGIVGSAAGAAAIALGLPKEALQGLDTTLGVSAPVGGAIAGAALLAIPIGTIGATAGIQSTRDARRFLGVHEADPMPEIPAFAKPLELPLEPAKASAPQAGQNSPALICRIAEVQPAAPQPGQNAGL